MSKNVVTHDQPTPLIIEGRPIFPGLAIAYNPSAYPEATMQAIWKRLPATEYRSLSRPGNPSASSKNIPYYAWFADSGDWLNMMDPQQENAYVPMSLPGWVRDICHEACNRHARGSDGYNKFYMYPNSAQIAWWRNQNPFYTPLAYTASSNDRWNPERRIVAAYFGRNPAWLYIVPSVQGNGKRPDHKSIRIKLQNGDSVSFVAPSEKREWDLKLVPFGDNDDKEDCFWAVFRIIAPLCVHSHQTLCPPVISRQGMAEEKRVIPLFLAPDTELYADGRDVIIPVFCMDESDQEEED